MALASYKERSTKELPLTQLGLRTLSIIIASVKIIA